MLYNDNDLSRAMEAHRRYEAWANSLDDETPKFTERDVERIWEAAIESTGEGWNGEWGYSNETQQRGVQEFLREDKRP